jgi:hypothetical protein
LLRELGEQIYAADPKAGEALLTQGENAAHEQAKRLGIHYQTSP